MPVGQYLTFASLGLATVMILITGFAWLWARLFAMPKRNTPTETPADYSTFRADNV
jgi:hypothetical protein